MGLDPDFSLNLTQLPFLLHLKSHMAFVYVGPIITNIAFLEIKGKSLLPFPVEQLVGYSPCVAQKYLVDNVHNLVT